MSGFPPNTLHIEGTLLAEGTDRPRGAPLASTGQGWQEKTCVATRLRPGELAPLEAKALDGLQYSRNLLSSAFIHTHAGESGGMHGKCHLAWFDSETQALGYALCCVKCVERLKRFKDVDVWIGIHRGSVSRDNDKGYDGSPKQVSIALTEFSPAGAIFLTGDVRAKLGKQAPNAPWGEYVHCIPMAEWVFEVTGQKLEQVVFAVHCAAFPPSGDAGGGTAPIAAPPEPSEPTAPESPAQEGAQKKTPGTPTQGLPPHHVKTLNVSVYGSFQMTQQFNIDKSDKSKRAGRDLVEGDQKKQTADGDIQGSTQGDQSPSIFSHSEAVSIATPDQLRVALQALLGELNTTGDVKPNEKSKTMVSLEWLSANLDQAEPPAEAAEHIGTLKSAGRWTKDRLNGIFEKVTGGLLTHWLRAMFMAPPSGA